MYLFNYTCIIYKEMKDYEMYKCTLLYIIHIHVCKLT